MRSLVRSAAAPACAALACAALASGTLAGCGGGSQLFGGGALTNKQYLAKLNAEQQKLAVAERQIPAHPRTPAALSRSIALLDGAVQKLASDLASIQPPSAVAAQHAQLIWTMRLYAAQLASASSQARAPGEELAASRLLISATQTASNSFSATVAVIDRTLR